MSRPRVLVVEDEAAAAKVIALNLTREGFEVQIVHDAAEALATDVDPDVILTDYRMPGTSGLELVHELARTGSRTPVIMMTAHGDERLAVEAMRSGTFCYLAKPLDYDELSLVCQRAAEVSRLRRELEGARAVELGERLLGTSPSVRRLRRLIAEVAPTEVTVLVRGETGTGKELVARAIHRASPRATKPFLAVNCSAFPETLLEAELFGHERGAFTGADRKREGRFRTAAGGTLFLDEIGDLPATLQPKLLRVLEEGAITPLGSDRAVELDVRLVAATNRPLEEMVEAKSFRQDLFYRLNVVPLVLPPLRERLEDIEELTSAFVARFADRHGKPIEAIDPALMEWLRAHEWPGNVRELENLVERLVIFAEDGVLRLPADGVEAAILPRYHEEKQRVVDEFECGYLRVALELSRGRLSEVCERTGLSNRQLYNLMRKHGLAKEDFFSDAEA
jgi:DNA-binding NtrC family response regulator